MIKINIPWMPELPSNWDLVRFKNLAKSKKEIAHEKAKDYERLALTLGGVIKRGKDDKEGLQPKEFDSYQILNKNDFVFKMIDLQNVSTSRVGLSPFTGLVSPAYLRFEPKKGVNSRYQYYYLMSLYYLCVFNKLAGNGVRSALNADDIGDIWCPFPPKETQENIVGILDAIERNVDALIENESKQIDHLKKYKSTIIVKAVTRGLNDDALLIDSGINWIGPIPPQGKIGKVKSMYNVTLGKMLCNEPKDDNYTLENYLCSANVKWGGVDTNISKQMWFSPKEKDIYKLNKGDLVVTEGGSVGESCIYEDEFSPCYIQNAVHKATGKNGNMPKYLYYWLFFLHSCKYFDVVCSKATMAHYTKEKFENTPIIYLPIESQKEIVNYLDSRCSKIDRLIDIKEKKIDSLNAYRKSLIYEYVTGKKKVR